MKRHYKYLLIILFGLLACQNTQTNKKHNAYIPQIKIINEASMDATLFTDYKSQFNYWMPKIYAYNHSTPPPATCYITDTYGIGSYSKGVVHVPSFFRPNSVVETFIHELAHHATGHPSTIFFKEGIAVCTLEALLEAENKIPQTWPQYGQTNQNWVKLYIEKDEMIPLDEAIAWPGYLGGTREGDFRSWQIYVIGGAFIKWYIEEYSYERFYEALKRKKFIESPQELEKKWFTHLETVPFIPFNPKEQLPLSNRYDYFVKRLK